MMVLATALLVLVACGTTPKKYYAKSSTPLKNRAQTSINIYSDCLIIDAPMTSSSTIDDEGNTLLCEEFVKQAQENFKALGFENVQTKLVSLGLHLNGQKERLSGVIYSNSLPKIILKDQQPDAQISEVGSALAQVANVSFKTRERDGFIKAQPNNDYSKLSFIKEMADDEYAVFIVSQGTRIPTSHSVGMAVGTALLTGGMYSATNTSLFLTKMVVVNNKGKAIWADITNKDVSERQSILYFTVGQIYKDLFSEFPEADQAIAEKPTNRKADIGA